MVQDSEGGIRVPVRERSPRVEHGKKDNNQYSGRVRPRAGSGHVLDSRENAFVTTATSKPSTPKVVSNISRESNRSARKLSSDSSKSISSEAISQYGSTQFQFDAVRVGSMHRYKQGIFI